MLRGYVQHWNAGWALSREKSGLREFSDIVSRASNGKIRPKFVFTTHAVEQEYTPKSYTTTINVNSELERLEAAVKSRWHTRKTGKTFREHVGIALASGRVQDFAERFREHRADQSAQADMAATTALTRAVFKAALFTRGKEGKHAVNAVMNPERTWQSGSGFLLPAMMAACGYNIDMVIHKLLYGKASAIIGELEKELGNQTVAKSMVSYQVGRLSEQASRSKGWPKLPMMRIHKMLDAPASKEAFGKLAGMYARVLSRKIRDLRKEADSTLTMLAGTSARFDMRVMLGFNYEKIIDVLTLLREIKPNAETPALLPDYGDEVEKAFEAIRKLEQRTDRRIPTEALEKISSIMSFYLQLKEISEYITLTIGFFTDVQTLEKILNVDAVAMDRPSIEFKELASRISALQKPLNSLLSAMSDVRTSAIDDASGFVKSKAQLAKSASFVVKASNNRIYLLNWFLTPIVLAAEHEGQNGDKAAMEAHRVLSEAMSTNLSRTGPVKLRASEET